MPTENRIDCPALHKRSNSYPFGDRVPRTVRMVKSVTADPMPGIGLAYIKGTVPLATQNNIYDAWTNSHGAVAAVMPDGRHLGLRPGEFEVYTWHDLSSAPAVSATEELDAVLHWRGKHAQAIRERDALQVRLNAATQMHPFAEKVIRKLERFQECADDGQGADIGRHWFDLLIQLGLLNRVQRSPALWEMTQQGEDALELSRKNAKSR